MTKSDLIEDLLSNGATSCCNPPITDDLQIDMEAIKGDAIGNTLYSSRFVLKTLLRLNDPTCLESPLAEDFEKDLCTLWDMTIEADVVLLLLEHHMLEHFGLIIRDTDDQRLTEILIGIIGNMCAVSACRQVLCVNSELMATLLHIVTCSDSLILIQLMRLLQSALVFENSGDEPLWFHHFTEFDDFIGKFSFLLENSNSNTLLRHAYDALNAMCVKFAVIEVSSPNSEQLELKDLFVKPQLVGALIVSLHQMLPRSQESDDETSAPTQNSNKIMNTFLDINMVLVQYGDLSRQCYSEHIEEFLQCLCQILEPLCQQIYLFPLCTNNQEIIESVYDIIQQLEDPFHEKLYSMVLRIWVLVSTQENTKKDEFDSDDDEDYVNANDFTLSLLGLLSRLSLRAKPEELRSALKNFEPHVVCQLHSALSAGDDPDISESCSMIEKAAKQLWQINFAKISSEN